MEIVVEHGHLGHGVLVVVAMVKRQRGSTVVPMTPLVGKHTVLTRSWRPMAPIVFCGRLESRLVRWIGQQRHALYLDAFPQIRGPIFARGLFGQLCFVHCQLFVLHGHGGDPRGLEAVHTRHRRRSMGL